MLNKLLPFRVPASWRQPVMTAQFTAVGVTSMLEAVRITNPACLTCHSSVEAAPKTMVDKYGPANGFGWNLNEVVSAFSPTPSPACAPASCRR